MCGICGFINKPGVFKKFDKRAFLTLAVNNDSRGGDGCGIMIDGKCEKAGPDVKYFANYWPTSQLIKETDKYNIAFAHCRKASVGGVHHDKNQPWCHYDENSKLDYCLIHNGTIKNYEELAKKYIPDIDIKGMTDSCVMMNIFYHCGYDVLQEYIGSGVFVMCDYRNDKPEVYMFKGKSKTSTYSAPEEERPLYVLYDGSTIVFSSIIDYLRTLYPNSTVMNLNPNLLIQPRNGELTVTKEYNREDMVAYSNTASKSNTTYLFPASGSGYYDDDEYDYDAIFRNVTTSVKKLTDAKKDCNFDVVRINEYLLYECDNKLCHGVAFMNEYGRSTSEKESRVRGAFFNGILLYNEACFRFLETVCDRWHMSVDCIMNGLPDLVYILSPLPFWDDQSKCFLEYNGDITKIDAADGDYVQPFESTMATFDNGARVRKTTYKSYTDGVAWYKERQENFSLGDAVAQIADYLGYPDVLSLINDRPIYATD